MLTKLTWLEVPKDEERFLTFLGEVMDVLELPGPPDASVTCEWCSHREGGRMCGL